jgi:DNA polymerase III epsilon subunit-like protein
MQHINFTTWFESKALQHIKQSINHLNQLMDEQIQSFKKDCNPLTDVIPPEYLEFQVERCLESFKISLLSELKSTSFNKKFITKHTHPIDKPIKLNTKNTLMQRAILFASAHNFQALPQLAFVDIETDSVNIQTANILQIAIIKPKYDSDHETLSHITTWSKYTKPYESYTQKDNKAYDINHIGDKELQSAMLIEDAIHFIQYHLNNTAIVGYNINNFDLPIIKRHLDLYQEKALWKFSIDLFPACWKNRKQKLEDAINIYNLCSNKKPHDAEADASCCIDLFNEIIERNELPATEEDLLSLFSSPQNTWQHYGNKKVIDINPDHSDYAHLLFPTPASSLKRKLSQISTP